MRTLATFTAMDRSPSCGLIRAPLDRLLPSVEELIRGELQAKEK